MALLAVTALAAGLSAPARAQAPDRAFAKQVYDGICAGCHAAGVLGAPKFGNATDWAPRVKAAGGIDGLVKSATAGTAKGMPPKGGRPDLSPEQLKAVIGYIMSGGSQTSEAAAKPAAAPAAAASAAAKPAATAKAEPKAEAKAAAAAAPAPAPALAPAPSATPAVVAAAGPPAAPPANRAVVPTPAPSREVNAFNRLLKPVARHNRPAVDSGIHDPANDMTLQLQPPATAFADLPKSPAGNHVDWVKALEGKAIAPRWDRLDPDAAAVVMDLNIVREVKGSMPDVVYPHKQHTEWLDCSNCHPAIFMPQKGSNQISMAAILLGQKCGVCHGKVAFPVSECRLCHSKKKAEPVPTSAANNPTAGERKP
jgi:c(7)-type cytochrome triheme protein